MAVIVKTHFSVLILLIPFPHCGVLFLVLLLKPIKHAKSFLKKFVVIFMLVVFTMLLILSSEMKFDIIIFESRLVSFPVIFLFLISPTELPIYAIVKQNSDKNNYPIKSVIILREESRHERVGNRLIIVINDFLK